MANHLCLQGPKFKSTHVLSEMTLNYQGDGGEVTKANGEVDSPIPGCEIDFSKKSWNSNVEQISQNFMNLPSPLLGSLGAVMDMIFLILF